MKFTDIPQLLTNKANYKVDVGFKYFSKTINQYIEEYGLILNPEFQRGHVWTEEQQMKYIEFILRGGKTGRDFYFNWNQKINEYVCVDGLQRTKAFVRFITGEIMVFGQYYDDFGFTKRVAGYNPLPEFQINVYMNHLENKKEILEWYVDMNSGGTPHTEKEIQKVKDMISKL